MTQSPEYPDLLWMPPKSWTDANRTSVQLLVIHDTEGSEGTTSAEDGASYDQRRTDGTSTHFFCDADTVVQCVRTNDVAHAARTQGNKRGIQYELCGKAGQGAAGWADSASDGTLRQAAKQVARDARKWGIPIRRLTPSQVAAGEKGICGHVDVTYAFPQDNGDHTDPGPTFPWSKFLGMVQAEMDGELPVDQTTFNKLMSGWAKSSDGKAALAAAVLDAPAANSVATGRRVKDVLDDLADARALLRLPAGSAEVTAAGYPASAPLVSLLAVPVKMAALEAKVDALAKPPAA